MKNKFEDPLLEAKDSVDRVRSVLGMLESSNIEKLKFIFENHLKDYPLPVERLHIEDLIESYNHELRFPDYDDYYDYLTATEVLYGLVDVIYEYNKEGDESIIEKKDKVSNKESVLSDYERGVLEPELDEDGDLTIPTTKEGGVDEPYLIFCKNGLFYYEDRDGEREYPLYKNTYRMYLAMKRFFESENIKDRKQKVSESDIESYKNDCGDYDLGRIWVNGDDAYIVFKDNSLGVFVPDFNTFSRLSDVNEKVLYQLLKQKYEDK